MTGATKKKLRTCRGGRKRTTASQGARGRRKCQNQSAETLSRATCEWNLPQGGGKGTKARGGGRRGDPGGARETPSPPFPSLPLAPLPLLRKIVDSVDRSAIASCVVSYVYVLGFVRPLWSTRELLVQPLHRPAERALRLSAEQTSRLALSPFLLQPSPHALSATLSRGRGGALEKAAATLAYGSSPALGFSFSPRAQPL